MSQLPRNPRGLPAPPAPSLPPAGAILGEARERLAEQADRELWTRVVLALAGNLRPSSQDPLLGGFTVTASAWITAQAAEVLAAIKAGPPKGGAA